MRVSREEHPLPHGRCGRKENPQQSFPAPSPPLGSCASSAELESDFDFKDHTALLGLGSTGAFLPQTSCPPWSLGRGFSPFTGEAGSQAVGLRRWSQVVARGPDGIWGRGKRPHWRLRKPPELSFPQLKQEQPGPGFLVKGKRPWRVYSGEDADRTMSLEQRLSAQGSRETLPPLWPRCGEVSLVPPKVACLHFHPRALRSVYSDPPWALPERGFCALSPKSMVT